MNTLPLVSSSTQASFTDVPDDGQYITIVRHLLQPLAKTFTLNSDGTVDKKSAANSAVLIAKTVRVTTHEQLAAVLSIVSENTHAALMNSYVRGTEDGKEFLFLSAMEIESQLGIPANSRNKQKGIHQVKINGQTWRAYGRFKGNLQPSVWQIADRDNDAHTPEKYARMSFAGWIIEADKLMPGFSDTSYVLTTSVSGRVLQDGQPVGGGNGHLWFKAANPDDIERLRVAILVRALQLGLTWPKPRYSKSSPGTVVGNGMATILDPSVYSVARLVFEGKPTVFGGLTVAPQSIIVHKGAQDTLDTQAATLPDGETVRKLTKANGLEMSISRNNTGLTITAYNLTLDTEIDTRIFGVITVRAYISMAIKDKLRCQAPYRESNSYAAFLFLDTQGNPFVHDSGTNTTHRLEGTEPDAFERCEFVEIDPVARTRTTYRLDGTRCVETEVSSVSMAIKQATNMDLDAARDAIIPPFEICDFEVITPSAPPAVETSATSNLLDQYSLMGCSAELENQAVEQCFVLDEIALMGQMTFLFAPPNSGKTLLTFSLLIEAIKHGRINPSRVYYINVDDSAQGLLEKNRFAEEFGFHMLSEGHRSFSAANFPNLLKELVEKDQASGVIIILDTVKNFVDVMDKTKCSRFTKAVRSFTLKGGTLIGLAHTNKNPGRNGKLVVGGTSDIRDDCDCAYTLSVGKSSAPDSAFVVFENIKGRGGVAKRAAYSYCTESGISYGEMLCSVRAVDESQFQPLTETGENASEATVIDAVKSCINLGVNSKMKLAESVAKQIKSSKQSVIRIIEKYTGVDPAIHHWTFAVKERGAKVFAVLDPVPDDN